MIFQSGNARAGKIVLYWTDINTQTECLQRNSHPCLGMNNTLLSGLRSHFERYRMSYMHLTLDNHLSYLSPFLPPHRYLTTLGALIWYWELLHPSLVLLEGLSHDLRSWDRFLSLLLVKKQWTSVSEGGRDRLRSEEWGCLRSARRFQSAIIRLKRHCWSLRYRRSTGTVLCALSPAEYMHVIRRPENKRRTNATQEKN